MTIDAGPAGFSQVEFRELGSKIDNELYVWGDDFIVLGQQPPPDPWPGDVDADGRVDGADHTIWADQFGAGMEPSGGAGGGQTPPAAALPACGLGFELILAMPGILHRRTRQRVA